MNHTIFCVVAFNLLLLTITGALETENIVGNLFAEPDQFKYAVSIRVYHLHVCGGSLIADNIVLTAAHCFIQEDRKFIYYDYDVTAGTIKSDEYFPDIHSYVEKVYITKEYQYYIKDGYINHDIAVVRLEDKLDVEENPHLTVLQLPAKDYKYDMYMEAVVVGFGMNEFKEKAENNKLIITGTSDTRLRYGTVLLYANGIHRYSKIMYGSAVKPTNGTFIGVCAGDSGSSVVNGSTILAIVSTVISCNQTQLASVLTRVAPYRNFIDAAMKDQPTEDTDVYHTNPGQVIRWGKKLFSFLFVRW